MRPLDPDAEPRVTARRGGDEVAALTYTNIRACGRVACRRDNRSLTWSTLLVDMTRECPQTGASREVVSAKSRLLWFPVPGSTSELIIKRPLVHDAPTIALCRNEIAVYEMFEQTPPSFRTPRLAWASAATCDLCFTALRGTTLSSRRFPPDTEIPLSEVDELFALAGAIADYRGDRKALRVMDIWSKVVEYAEAGILPAHGLSIVKCAYEQIARRTFAHGDFRLSNILHTPGDRLGVVDWEYAGTYPPHYDRALLNVHLADATNARARLLWLSEGLPTSDQLALWVCTAFLSAHEIKIHRRDMPGSTHEATSARVLSDAMVRLEDML